MLVAMAEIKVGFRMGIAPITGQDCRRQLATSRGDGGLLSAARGTMMIRYTPLPWLASRITSQGFGEGRRFADIRCRLPARLEKAKGFARSRRRYTVTQCERKR